MQTSKPLIEKVDQSLAAEPFKVGARTIQPVAHLAGWRLDAGSDTAGFHGAGLRVTPQHIAVTENNHEYTIPIIDPTAGVLRSMTLVGIGVSVACALIMLLTGFRSR